VSRDHRGLVFILLPPRAIWADRQVRRCQAPLCGKAEIGSVVSNMIDGHKVARHVVLTITDDSFVHDRESICAFQPPRDKDEKAIR
jgi:hypothetical protein